MTRFILTALALAIGASSTASAGTGTASFKFLNLNISVIDLNPDDSLTSSYQVLPSGAPTRVYASIGDTWENRIEPGVFTPLTSSVGDASRNATASISPEGFELVANGMRTTASVASSNEYQGPPSANIRLTPGTGIVVAGIYNALLDADCRPAYSSCTASAELQARFVGSGSGQYFEEVYPNGEADHTTTYYQYFANDSGTQTFTGTAGVAYWNFNDYSQDITLYFTARAYVWEGWGPVITPVPEPAVTSMILAGVLAMVAWRQRRRTEARLSIR